MTLAVIQQNSFFACHGSSYSTQNTTKFSDWLISQNQVFSLVEMTSSISCSLYDLSVQDFYHTCPLHIYIHVMHLTFFGRIFKHTIMEIVYNGKGTQKQNTFPLLGFVSQLNEFHPIPSQIFTTYN